MVAADNKKLGHILVSKLHITFPNNTLQAAVWSHNILLPKTIQALQTEW